ncbi:MAG: hypothetical protein J6K21_04910 [Bacilli bacterium]|nr:hypothetical protein [Bacilli bacterium]
MKLILENEDNIILAINNENLDNIDFKNNEEIKEYFRKIFFKIKERYKILLNGFYYVRIYKDKYYGIFIEIEKSEMDFYDYYIDEIDMHIEIEQSIFLYQINDIYIPKELKKKNDIILYQNNIYLKVNRELSNIEKGKLTEISNILYKNVDKILKYGRILTVNN